MAQPVEASDAGLPHEIDHKHSDVSGGWLRAASFGAMDGLVSNTALIAGIAAGGGREDVIVGGFAGLLAGAFSMAIGEYTSVTAHNEQIDAEVRVEQEAFRRCPEAEKRELVQIFVDMGMTEHTARAATDEIHADEPSAVNFHIAQELGIDPREKPSARLAAILSFVMFATGAIVPLIPYLLGFDALLAGLACGGVGLVIVGGLAARFTGIPVVWASARQLAFGATAIAATYAVGTLVGRIV